MGDLREEQLITTYGPGSIIDLLDYPVLIQSASYWLKEEKGNNYDPVNSESLKIQDLAIHELVEKKLVELTEGSSFKIKKIKGLMKPPPEANEFNQYLGTIASKVITAQRFPRYHKCLKCNTLSKLDKEDQDTKCRKCGGKLEATRWILTCKNGHIHDFNWHKFMRDKTNCDCDPADNKNGSSSLTYRDSGRSGTFRDIKLRCETCEKEVTLSSLKNDEMRCNGKMRWFKDTSENCGEILKFEPRGKSSIYVSETLNKISLPKEDKFSDLNIDHSHVFDMLRNDNSKDGLKTILSILKVETADIDEYFTWLNKHNESSDFLESNKNYEEEEFRLLSSDEAISDAEFNSEQIDLTNSKFVSSHFQSINKISRLKIVNALLGFRRAFEENSKFHAVTTDEQFIPAVESFGEGIFFKMNNNLLDDWSSKNDKNVDKYKLLHSLSHFLMHEFAYVSGFSITELKEIIYYQDEGKDTGILIYTSSGDSQCSMGGLADLADAEKIESIIKNGLNKITACSNDPFCINEHQACFSCLMTPEICCNEAPQEKNTKLSRAYLAKITETTPFFDIEI